MKLSCSWVVVHATWNDKSILYLFRHRIQKAEKLMKIADVTIIWWLIVLNSSTSNHDHDVFIDDESPHTSN